MSPNLTLLYHHMINLISSHDKPHHHMMNNIFGYRVRLLFPSYAYMTYDQSKELSHSMCIRNSLNLEIPFLKPKYYIYLILELIIYSICCRLDKSTVCPCHFDIFDHAFVALLPLRDLQFSLVL